MSTATTGVAHGAALAVLTLCACNPRDRNAADTAAGRVGAATETAAGRVGAAADTAANRVGAAIDTAARRVQSAAGRLVRTTPWTDASILAFTSAASTGEIRESELATRKATNPAVKEFARQLVADHRRLANELKSLATKLSVTPDTADSDVRGVTDHVRDEVKELTDKPAGLDWDREYIDNQIDDHKDLLEKLQDAAKATATAEMRGALEKASGKVQEHLTKAQAIKDNQLKS